jgi:chromosome segregation ATPase
MKTEQEQIKAIKQIIDERVETTLGQVQGRHGNVIKTVDTVIIARDIVNAGYGDVSEYKAEIELLKMQMKDVINHADTFLVEEQKFEAENVKLKAEIEQLRTALGQCNTELNSALENLKSQCREIGELKAKVKQAQIDILNKAKEKFNAISRELGDDCDLCGVSAVCSCRCEINNLIKEIENEKKD